MQTRTRRTRVLRHVLGIVSTVAVIAALIVVPSEAARADGTWTTPEFVRTIGGKGRAGVYAWGLAYNPVSQEILVGDYLDYEIRRYDLDGNHLGDFYRSPNSGQPYSLAVDPRDGSVYVPEISDATSQQGWVAKYDKTGAFLGASRVEADYQAWLAVDSNGNLWVSDSHYWNSSYNPPEIHEYQMAADGSSNTLVQSWPVQLGTDMPRMYGITVATDGRVFATDSINRQVHVWDSSGNHLYDFGTSGTPGVVGGLSGDVRGISLDEAADRAYVVDAADNQIEVYTLAGVPVTHWGGDGPAAGQLSAPRQPAVDGAGHVWVSEYGNFRAQEFDATGTSLLTLPSPARDPEPGAFGEPRDVAVDGTTGKIWVADTWNQRFQRFGSDGSFEGTWGARSSNPPYGMNYPRAVGVDPENGNVWVVNQRGHHIRVYDSNANYLGMIGSEPCDSSDPGCFRWPSDVAFWQDRAIVADRVSGRVKILDKNTFAELASYRVTNHGVAVDPATGNIYVVNQSRRRVEVIDQDGNSLFRFGERGSEPGQFDTPWSATISEGVLYVTDATLDRVQAFTLDGTFLGSWGDEGGLGAYALDAPSGIDHDAAGRIYVADAIHDRISVFDPHVARPAPESTIPTVTMATPVSGVVSADAITISGTAADDTAVAAVQVAVRDTSTGLYWNPHNASWVTWKYWSLTPWWGAAPSQSVSYEWAFKGVTRGASYAIDVRAMDTSGNYSWLKSASVSVLSGTPDVAPPDATLTSPAPNAVLPGGPVTFTGTATDDVSVASVRIGVRDRTTGLWWQPGGGWGAFAWLTATTASPGAATTTWSYQWSPPADGSYGVLVDAVDASSKTDPSRTWVTFSTSTAPPDTTPPAVTLTSPPANTPLPLGPVNMAGAATDDVGVTSVRVAIRDNATLKWWTGSGWGTFTNLAATVATPGATSTTWSYTWAPPAPGTYGMQVSAVDAAGNVSPVRPWRTFTVTP